MAQRDQMCFLTRTQLGLQFKLYLLRMRARKETAIARANGRFKANARKLVSTQQSVLFNLRAGEHSIAALAELFSVSRATAYRDRRRHRGVCLAF